MQTYPLYLYWFDSLFRPERVDGFHIDGYGFYWWSWPLLAVGVPVLLWALYGLLKWAFACLAELARRLKESLEDEEA